MGLAQSQEETMRLIYSDPNFRDWAASSIPQRFQATIRQFGYTEQRYLAEQRRARRCGVRSPAPSRPGWSRRRS